MTADYEVWHAMHDDCPPEGCGACVVEDIEWDLTTLRRVRDAAKAVGEDFDVFVNKALSRWVKRIMDRA